MMNTRFCLVRRCLLAAGCGVLAFAAPAAEEAAAAKAPADPLMEAELKFVDAMIEANYVDLVGPVVDAARKRWKAAGPRLKALEMKVRLRVGKFDEVKAEIDKVADKNGSEYWAMNLALADAYYANGKEKECGAIYKAFFDKVKKPGEDIRALYIESAYKWAQMLIRSGREDEATVAYEGLMAQVKQAGDEDSERIWNTVAVDDTQLLLKLAAGAKDAKARSGYLDRANKIVSGLLWSEDALVFGRAVSMRAHIELLRGRIDKAQRTIEDYLPRLRDIHNQLAEQDPKGLDGLLRLSPMPECRYMLAKMMWDEVRAEVKKPAPDEAKIKDLLLGERGANGKRNGAGAFNHAVNVFVKYPESTWAAAAGDMTEAIAGFVKERYKTEIRTNVTEEQKNKVRQMQFASAHETYRMHDYPAAAKAYLDALSQFPDGVASIPAIGNLVDCWLNMAADEKDAKAKESLLLDVEALEGFLGERFGGLGEKFATPAGDQTLRFAARENDFGSRKRSQRLYDLYFRNYPTHHQAAQMAASLAGRAFKAEDWATATRYYKVVVESYAGSPYYEAALGCLSSAAGKTGDTAAELDWLRKFAEVCKKPVPKTSARLRLAYGIRRDGTEMLKAAETNSDEAVSAELRQKGAAALKAAEAEFRQVVAMAEAGAKDPVTSAEDKEKFSGMREDAMFLAGDAVQRIPAAGGAEDPRDLAARRYDEYLAAYPKGRYAPAVLVKLGTIYMAQTNTVKQQEAFQRLERDFPESEEAKNSKPRLAKALMDMGLQSEAIRQYTEMIGTDGKYSAAQFMAAGQALLESRGRDALDTAITAFDKALAKAATNEVSVIANSRLGKAEALYLEKRYPEAQEILEAFIEDKVFGRTTLVVKANTMLIDVASAAGSKEKNDDVREKDFAVAVKALKAMTVRAKDDPKRTQELELALGDIHARRLAAEVALGDEKKAQAEKTRGLAAASYQAFILAHSPSENYPVSGMKGYELDNLERAIASALPLLVELGNQAENVLKYGELYLETFPEGRNRTNVINAMNQAKIQQ